MTQTASRPIDPATQPGNLVDHMVTQCRGLKVGGKISLADGTTIKAIKAAGRSERWFMTTGRGPTDQMTSKDAHAAVRGALNLSVRSRHPESVGGTKVYPDYETFRRKNS